MKTTISINTNSVDRFGNIFHKNVLQQIIEQAQEIPVYYQKGEHQAEILIGFVESAKQVYEGIHPDIADETIELDIKLDEFSESDDIQNKPFNFVESLHFQILAKTDKENCQEITKARLMGINFEPLRSEPHAKIGFRNDSR